MTWRSRKTAVLLLACLAATIAGCGRRGPLEPPPNAPAAAAQAQPAAPTFGGGTTFRPARQTETDVADVSDPAAPPMPQMQPGAGQDAAVPVGSQTISAGSAGLRTTPRDLRRSGAPQTPFLLDPLL